MPKWVAAPEDALAFYFAREESHPIRSVTVFDKQDTSMTVAITWAEHAYELPAEDLTTDIEWISSAGIGRKDVHLPALFEALSLSEDDLEQCDRTDCRNPADQFVLWTATYWKRAPNTPQQDIQQFCLAHVPSTVPFHTNFGTVGPCPPGFGWTPGR